MTGRTIGTIPLVIEEDKPPLSLSEEFMRPEALEIGAESMKKSVIEEMLNAYKLSVTPVGLDVSSLGIFDGPITQAYLAGASAVIELAGKWVEEKGMLEGYNFAEELYQYLLSLKDKTK